MLLPAWRMATHNITVLCRGCCLPACVFVCMDHRSGVSLMGTSYWWSLAPPESLKGTLRSLQDINFVQSINWLGPSLVPTFPVNQNLPPWTRPSLTYSLFLDVSLLLCLCWFYSLFLDFSFSSPLPGYPTLTNLTKLISVTSFSTICPLNSQTVQSKVSDFWVILTLLSLLSHP